MIHGDDPQIDIQFVVDRGKKRPHNFRRQFFHVFIFQHIVPHPVYAVEIIRRMTDAQRSNSKI